MFIAISKQNEKPVHWSEVIFILKCKHQGAVWLYKDRNTEQKYFLHSSVDLVFKFPFINIYSDLLIPTYSEILDYVLSWKFIVKLLPGSRCISCALNKIRLTV